MEFQVVVHVFEWKGRWHWYAEAVHPTPRKKFARRVRLASDTSQGEGMDSALACFSQAAEYLDWWAHNKTP